MPPSDGWSCQEHGREPAPTFEIVEPLEAVNRAKAEGNEAFKEGKHEAAIEQYARSSRTPRLEAAPS